MSEEAENKTTAGNGNNTVELATELTIAWLSNPNTRVAAEEVPAFLKAMHGAVESLSPAAAAPAAAPAAADDAAPLEHAPAVTARKSLANPNHIISMIDGKPYKTLKRHLSGHGLTPQDYRSRYGLKADYPMVAPAYSEARRAMAKKIGLGRKPGETRASKAAKSAAAPKPAAVPKPRRARKTPAAAAQA